MKLSILLHERYLLPEMQSTTRDDAIKELLSLLDLENEQISKEEIFSALIKREKEQTTGIGEGTAFPHARFPKLNKLHIAIGISKNGVEFNSIDHKPVNYIILMLVNRGRPNELLKARAAIAKLLRSISETNDLLSLKSSKEFSDIVESADIDLDYEITAKDIMKPAVAYIDSGLNIHEAARTLHRYHCDSLPVVSKNNLFLGNVSCFDLFSVSLPSFFNNLNVVSFVKHMDPFENYFKVDRSLTVMELIKGKDRYNNIISSEATLMEIIFEMTVKNKEILYILDQDRRLIGVLDRYSIIDKVLMTR